jgi:hypothetical protein
MKRLVLVVLALGLVAPSACRDNYSKEVEQAWRSVFQLKPDDGPYRWMGYPVDNFGVLTAYDPPAGSTEMGAAQLICDTWYCAGVEDADIPKSDTADGLRRRLEVKGLVALGEGPGVTLTETRQREIGIKLVLPALAKVLKLDAHANWKKSVETTVTLGEAFKRAVRRDRYQAFIEKESTNKTLKTAFTNGRLNYVAGDIVVTKSEVKIVLKKNFDAGVKAELDTAVKSLGKGSSLDLSGSSATDGTYTLKINSPMILAVQMRAQPGAGVLSAGGRDGNVANVFPSRDLLSFSPSFRKP